MGLSVVLMLRFDVRGEGRLLALVAAGGTPTDFDVVVVAVAAVLLDGSAVRAGDDFLAVLAIAAIK